MIVRARAPVRIDFAGGWTDVPHFADREGGVVVNAALALHVHVECILGGATIRLRAEDLGEHVTLTAAHALRYDGKLDLLKAALNMLPVTGGIEILTQSDVPVGSGLGASGALDVALAAALAAARDEHYAAVELAELGYDVEAAELGLEGGRQDQYAAALGGWNELRVNADGVEARRIEADPAVQRELSGLLVLAYTGQSHFSSQTHERVWTAYREEKPDVVDALRAMRALGEDAAAALRAGDWPRLGAVMDANWAEQQRLDVTIATPAVRKVEAALRTAGVHGLKATGAGAGGCLVALAPNAPDVRRAAAAAGARVLDVAFDMDGVRVTRDEDPRG